MAGIDTGLIGIGLYTVPEAGKLSGVPAARIRRWLCGYRYRQAGEVRFSGPIWKPQLEPIEDSVALGFQDLMEVRFIDRFVSAGISLQTIRKAAQHAREVFGKDRPFSSRRFRTDGRTIFAEVAAEDETVLLDLVRSQYGFSRIISPSIYTEFDFDESDSVRRWWPLGKSRRIVVDPARAFGQPIVKASGIPTRVLAEAVEAEGSVEAVAKWYEVPRAEVRDALAFERKLPA